MEHNNQNADLSTKFQETGEVSDEDLAVVQGGRRLPVVAGISPAIDGPAVGVAVASEGP